MLVSARSSLCPEQRLSPLSSTLKSSLDKRPVSVASHAWLGCDCEMDEKVRGRTSEEDCREERGRGDVNYDVGRVKPEKSYISRKRGG